MSDPQHKLESLQKVLADMKSVLLAYSGGVDSSLLLRVSSDVLGDRITAVTATSVMRPAQEHEAAKELASAVGVEHLVVETDDLSDPHVASNATDRCYHCKRRVFGDLVTLAKERGLKHVIDGSNADDRSDYRPGARAAEELGVRSPLREVGLTKSEIRDLSRRLGLPTWNKPAAPCLATRFPYDTELTRPKLERVARAEELIADLGLTEFRVRDHGDTARIEARRDETHLLLDDGIAAQVAKKLRRLGYRYVTLDLEGYRMGSMNEGIEEAVPLGDTNRRGGSG